MEYRSVSDLNHTIFSNSYRFPQDGDLIVGIPRSGLLAANLVALNLNLPLLDLESFLGGITPCVGRTVKPSMPDSGMPIRKVIVIDDSILTGLSMAAARERIAQAEIDAEFYYCAIYGTQGHHPEVDLCLEQVAHPRIFQWNLMRHNRLADACFDIDGVLCHDPSTVENDDGRRYVEFLLNARPLMKPRTKIGHLVTSRLEKYRPQTQQWLTEQGIAYDKLWMLDMASGEERRRTNAHAGHKAAVYARTGAGLFVESDDEQAVRIASLSGRPVLSIEGQRMVWPTDDPTAARRRYRKTTAKSSGNYGAVRSRRMAVRLLRLLIGDKAVDRIKTMAGSNVLPTACLMPLLL